MGEVWNWILDWSRKEAAKPEVARVSAAVWSDVWFVYCDQLGVLSAHHSFDL